jgi:alkylhydroperoxidase family enzyme
MGHSEMVLAVAGLDKQKIAARNRRLASGDWSAFTPRERTAFAFAHKQARNPAGTTAQDFQSLLDQLGTAQTLDAVWWIARCHYMIHVAEAFQLPLERHNIFDGFLPFRVDPSIGP